MSKTMADLAHDAIECSLDATDLAWDTTWERDLRPGSPCGVIVATVEGALADGAIKAPRGWTVTGRTDKAGKDDESDVTTLTFAVDVDAWRETERRIDALAARCAVEFLEQGWCDEDGGGRLADASGDDLAQAVGADAESEVAREEWRAFVREVRRLLPPPVCGNTPDEDLTNDERNERNNLHAEYLAMARKALAPQGDPR